MNDKEINSIGQISANQKSRSSEDENEIQAIKLLKKLRRWEEIVDFHAKLTPLFHRKLTPPIAV